MHSTLTQRDWALIEKACSWAAMETKGIDREQSRDFSRLVHEASKRRAKLLGMKS